MDQRRKLQVFVSSTYADLREERQAAVEAILTAGHIPAGMELFAAGDESQMQAIRRWIEESDVFLLILGGRYGSIEPVSGKSYIHLEYEHALSLGKPVFAVVIDADHLEQRVKQLGSKAIETEHSQRLRAFRDVVLSRIVRFWLDPRDIKLAVLETLPEYARRTDLAGWVRGTDVDFARLAEEIARLTKENADMRAALNRSSSASAPTHYAGLAFDELYALLANTPIPFLERFDASEASRLSQIASLFSDAHATPLYAFFMISPALLKQWPLPRGYPRDSVAARLAEYGLVHNIRRHGENNYYQATEAGRQFFLRLLIARDAAKGDSLRDSRHGPDT